MLVTPKVAGNLLLFAASIRINTTLSIGKVYYGKHSYTCVEDEEWLLLIRLIITNMLVHVHSSVRVTNGVGESGQFVMPTRQLQARCVCEPPGCPARA